ncbi:disease resistance protein RPV1-like [Cryptomeria japonica]|uniref:disease resistance protein RPV1-like n=1 Tax=Cryptomeria japonica TaxID=3369 RepID=UPI0027DA607F|nr:disease resistance protein RPV1-like [Cryptomeria japonica]
MLLEHLNLFGCSDLKFTSEDINFLKSLTKLDYLNLSYCKQLEEFSFPASLRELDFHNTSLRELTDNIGQLSKLRKMLIAHVLLTACRPLLEICLPSDLEIKLCKKLECLPNSLENLSSLTNITISCCPELQRLPDSLGDLSSFTNLQIVYCNNLERLPDSLGDLSSLTNLSIKGCPKLERQGVKSLPKSIRQLNNLQELNLSMCPISELDFGAASLSNLKKIYLGETEVCRISFSEDSCPHLESLGIFENKHLEEIEALPKTLQTIVLVLSEMLKSIPSLAGFTSLRGFCLRGCDGIEKIEGLEGCTSLQVLKAEFEEAATQRKQGISY